MPETPPATDSTKKPASYAAGIAAGVTAALVWFIDHSEVEAKEGLKLAAPMAGLISTRVVRLVVRRVDLLVGTFQLRRWIQKLEQERVRIEAGRLSVAARRRLSEIDVELKDYRQQLYAYRSKMFTFFEW